MIAKCLKNGRKGTESNDGHLCCVRGRRKCEEKQDTMTTLPFDYDGFLRVKSVVRDPKDV